MKRILVLMAAFTVATVAPRAQTSTGELGTINFPTSAKPAAAKGRYIRRITLTSTMGPGIHVDPARTRGIAEELEEEQAEPVTA